jgi:hypothetical protein
MSSMFNMNFTPSVQYVHPTRDYDPVYGNPGKVNQPGINLMSNHSVPPKYIEDVTPTGLKLLNSQLYQDAYMDRKMHNYYQQDRRLEPAYKFPPVYERKLTTLDGKQLSSRDPYRSMRETQTFNKINVQKEV